ncbi:DUF6415 family natural product biosynthesis protein [Streptomyces sp. NBC_01471]|uniref:DUF6415 family natural product biosynthesis protein n=1 Tax=Streptomyces sp. NBC_01471 TaxID=2903879 RepID=UPI00324659F0
MNPPTAIPDKVQILALVKTSLCWNLNSSDDLPALAVSLDVLEQCTSYGQALEGDLRERCDGLPVQSAAYRRAQETLGEAGRRLHGPAPARTAFAAARRAQNVARLVQTLLRVTGSAAPVEPGSRT